MPSDTRILAVDDRTENLTALAAVLDALPVEVVPVTSGQAALKELLNDEFALILLDVVMPEMDGFETAAHIKARPRTRDIPIIFLTAGGESGEQAFRGYAAGAVDYLTKPFDPWLLRAKVSVFVELHRRHLQLRRQARLLRQSLAEGADGNGDGAAAGGDRLLTALDERLRLVEDDVQRLRTGEPAGELDEHVADLRLALDALSAGG
ncbi:response regulator receiver domain-containing protein [Actinomadura pelletieri DSM 43383]|uniref:Response regulator receiver domain-containing protein n=1 Tax=Actinomadura pelletieri DSM 43383 TaxID=1120940 RepID=A0A495QSU9_9ACTN|nr:response regulator [Actinomadura pelletieri]RKS76575.1 response regulator receiver domain-containing protein [Actinomadura pelletieri DSM 43383]